MNYQHLNEMIDYIENHLTEIIDSKKLAKIVGVSEYALKRIFVFLTDITLTEYIKKRRLSKAFEEIKTSDAKIIDIALKYQYESSISFARAFKKLFGISPSECRKMNSYKLFPVISFKNGSNLCDEYNYEIETIENLELYGVSVKAKTNEELLFKIRNLYLDIKNNGFHKKFNKMGMYGVSLCDNLELCYFVGSKNKDGNLEKINIPKGRYAKFSIGSRKQKNIVKTEEKIYNQWLDSIDFELNRNLNFEFYINDNCYLYVPLKR